MAMLKDTVIQGNVAITGDTTTSNLEVLEGVTIAGTLDVGTITADTITGYAKLASPAFTGNPTATTQTAGNNSTRIATTAFVTTAINNAIGSAISASY